MEQVLELFSFCHVEPVETWNQKEKATCESLVL